MGGSYRGPKRDYEQEYNALARALVGDTGLSAIMEASKHRKMLEFVQWCADGMPNAAHDYRLNEAILRAERLLER